MKKGKGRFSLGFGFLSLLLALTLALGIVLPLFGTNLGFLERPLRWLASFMGFSALASIYGLIPLACLFLLWAIMAFSFRGRKPFSFILIPLTALMYFTVFLLSQMLQQTGRPQAVMHFLLSNGASLRSASLKVVLAFLFETVLFVILTLFTDMLNDHHKKKKAFAQKVEEVQGKKTDEVPLVSRKEKRRLAKLQNKLTEEETVVVLKQKQLPKEQSSSGKMEFPQVMEVPTLGSFSKSSPDAVAKAEAIEVQEKITETSSGLASIGALHTIKQEHMRDRALAQKERKAEKKDPPADKAQKIPLSGFLQGALEVVGKGSSQPVTPVPERTGKATGMLANAVAETEVQEKHGFFHRTRSSQNPSEVTITSPVEVTVNKGTLDSGRSLENDAKKPDDLIIHDRILSVRPFVETPPSQSAPISVSASIVTSQEDFPPKPAKKEPIASSDEDFPPKSVKEPIVSPVENIPKKPAKEPEPSAPVPVASEASPEAPAELELTDDLDAASGVGGLSSTNGGKSALLNRSKFRYTFPPEDILVRYPKMGNTIDEETYERGEKLVATLLEFNIRVELISIVRGPTVTMFEILPAPGVRVNTIVSLSDNLALSLAAIQVRIVAPIPGKSAVGIEIPNRKRDVIGFREMIASIDEKHGDIPMVLGKNLMGEPIVIDVGKAPHLLIAGATGSGKSVCVNSMICSILFRKSPKQVRLILVDPKIVELNIYNGIPHLLTPVITDPKKTLKAFDFCLYEMDRRYRLLQGINARNITGYNEKIDESHLAREKLPFIVVVIDEFADLMHTVGKELENKVSRLAAMSRAVGIHLILATQRPSVDVITGVIKSNIPTRIAFAVTSTTDSRIIIDEGGAEKLLGKGDMLYVASSDPISMRIQGAYLSDNEVEEVVKFASSQGVPDFIDEAFFDDEPSESDNSSDPDMEGNDDDELMEKALQIVVERKCASASYLQRRLKIGYNRAARLVEQMEDMGYVGPPNGSKPRELIKYPS
ncbi:DNA translocase FtsK [uncultured Sphaerochaeta sp.]|uniref:DNA translocase FtsK n=1 Tax=uncultured Sphaerochaeta sp. TaxID=886478 RepID=UPI002A0A11F9|nr:DNA translocase FtsK [uncultured Sphaerochaeta sp.]